MADQQNTGRNEPRLDHVQKGQAITADAWNKIVDRLNTPIEVSIKRTRRMKSSDGVEIRLARLASSWSYDNTAKAYHATACFYDNGSAQTGYTFDVYAPAVSNSATLARQVVNSTRFWIIFRNNRWELLIYNDPTIKTVTGGSGISVAETDSSYAVSNTGVTEAKVVNDTSYTRTGALSFSKRMFEWVSGELDSSTKVIGVKYKQVQVVTDVALRNGALDVTKSELVVIDYQYG